SRRRHTRFSRDWSSDVCSSDLNQACRQGLSVRYLRVPRLFEQLRIAHGDGSYARLMNQLQKTDLLILDDWGMQKVTSPQRQDLRSEERRVGNDGRSPEEGDREA